MKREKEGEENVRREGRKKRGQGRKRKEQEKMAKEEQGK